MKEKLKNPEKHIPKGVYCYDNNGVCPFYDKDESLPEQSNGYCHYLGMSDEDINKQGGILYDVEREEEFEVEYHPFGGHLWDQIKECEINVEVV